MVPWYLSHPSHLSYLTSMSYHLVPCRYCLPRISNNTATPSGSSCPSIVSQESATRSVTVWRTGRSGSGCVSSRPGRSRSTCSRTVRTVGRWCGSRSWCSRRASRACSASYPGVEPAPYILRFNEDRPNPFYRRFCYTLAWSEVASYALLNIAGLVDAIVNGVWRMRAIYDVGYLSDCGDVLAPRR